MARGILLYRFFCYYKSHGVLKTIHHSIELIWNSLFRRKHFLFYVDLSGLDGEDYQLPENLTIECRKSEAEISEQELSVLALYRKDRVIKHLLKERFSKDATLWLVNLDSELVGLVWSIKAATIEPYYFPLTDSDVHLFDNEIFSKYRGRGINSHLIDYVLFSLRKEGAARAYIETKVKNIPEIKSLAKTQFRKYGSATKVSLFGRTIMCWSANNNA